MRKILADDVSGTKLGYGLSVNHVNDYEILAGAYGVEAAYLLTLDPSTGNWTIDQKIQPSVVTSGDHFGVITDIHGDYLVVGAPLNDTVSTDCGAAYVFQRIGGVWTQVAKLTPSDDKYSSGQFGISVAIGDGVIAVGCLDHGTGPINSGGVFIYRGSGSTWVEDQIIDPQSTSNWYSGYRLSMSGNTLAILARKNDYSGIIYTYVDNGSSFVLQQSFSGSDATNGDCSNYCCVSIYENRLVYGAANATVGASTDAGVAYIFDRTGTTWSESQKITSSTVATSDLWGAWVSLYGDRIVIGKRNSTAGYASLFDYSGGSWSETVQLTPLPGRKLTSIYYSFARYVLLGKGFALCACPNHNLNGGNTGIIYAYVKDSDGDWYQCSYDAIAQTDRAHVAIDNTTMVTAHYNISGGTLIVDFRDRVTASTWTKQTFPSITGGYASVAISGEWSAIGCYPNNKLRMYRKVAGTWGEVQVITPPDGVNSLFAQSVEFFDNSTLLVGSPNSHAGSTGCGAVFVYLLVSGTWTYSKTIFPNISDRRNSQQFGVGISTDGITVVISAPGDSLGIYSYSYGGSVFIFDVAAGTYTQAAKLVSGDKSEYFGGSSTSYRAQRTINIKGDIIIIGEPDESSPQSHCGKAYIFEKSAGVWSKTATITPFTAIATTAAAFGIANAVIDNDTVIIGAYKSDCISYDAGDLYIYRRSGGSWVGDTRLRTYMQAPDEIYQFSDASDRFGSCPFVYDDTSEIIALYVNKSIVTYEQGSFMSPPYVENRYPVAGATNVDIDGYIGFDIKDDDGDLDFSSVVVQIEGNIVFENENFLDPFNTIDSYMSEITDGYYLHFKRSSNFPNFSEINITVDAYDLNSSFYTTSWSFLTADQLAPTLTGQYPANNTSGWSRNLSKIYFSIVDDSDIIFNTIDAYVNGSLAFSSGTFYGNFAGPNSTYTTTTVLGLDGYYIELDYTGSQWGSYDLVTVEVLAQDAYGNSLDGYWSFYIEDYVNPFITGRNPIPGSTGNAITTEHIDFVVLDQGSGLQFIDAYVNGFLAFSDFSFNSPFNGTDAYYSITNVDGYDGYFVRLDYINVPWNQYQLVQLEVFTKDSYGNSLDETWNFRIEDSIVPFYDRTSISPVLGGTNISQSAVIKIDIFDQGSGIDPTSINAIVNGVTAYNGSQFINPYNGAFSSITPINVDGYDGYRIKIDKKGAYKSGELVTVRVEAKDKAGN